MKQKTIINIIAISIFIMLFSLPAKGAMIVNKATNEFSIESPYPTDNVKSCQCGTRTEIINVKNLGDFETLYKVEISSPIKDLISISENTFDLSPGKEKAVYVYINAPCDTSINSFYIASVCTNYGRSKEIYKNFVSQKCQNIKFESKIMQKEILPGETATIKVEIQNVGEFEDTFKIISDNHKEFITLSEEAITLAPDQKKSIFMYLTLPISVYGKQTIPFTIISEKNKGMEKGIEEYEIIRDYDYSIKTETLEINTCENIEKTEKIIFENLASTQNKYYLSIDAPIFTTLSQKELTLNPKEKDSIELKINPTQTDIGEYEIILRSASEFGQINKEKNIILKVKDCFDTKISIKNDECDNEISCEVKEEIPKTELTDKACAGEKKYVLNIKNYGLNELSYEIITDSEGWIKVEEEDRFVRLRKAQQINIPIKAILPDTDAKQTSFIIVKQLSAPYETHEVKIELESQSERSCNNIELLQDSYTIDYETQSIPLLLQSTGVKAGTYTLELGELESKFIYLEEEEINFEPGEAKVLRVYTKNITGYEEGKYLNKLNLKISPKGKEISYDRQFWVVLKDKSFLYKAFIFIKSFDYTRIGLCGLGTIILFLLLAIAAITLAYMKLKKDFKIKRIKISCMKKIKIINTVIISLMIVCVVLLFLIGNPNMNNFYEEPTNNNSTLYHEWKQNTPYEIDLNLYFADPDGDKIIFSASQPDHINVRIEENKAILTPEFGWSGEEHIIFSAIDEDKEETDGEIMTLRVLKRKPIGIIGYWNLYCKQINIVFLILLLSAILMIIEIIEEKGFKHYNPQKIRTRK